MLGDCIFNVIIIKLQIFLMIFGEAQVQFRIRVQIRNLELRILIMQKHCILEDPDPQHWFCLLQYRVLQIRDPVLIYRVTPMDPGNFFSRIRKTCS
jgi:hypothetical protein